MREQRTPPPPGRGRGGGGGANETSISILAQAALSYARHAWAVFPLRPGGKEPLTPHGFKDATTDEAAIREWWSRWPNANLGIATGSVSGLVVLDVDPRHGGDESLRDLEAHHGPLPDTVTALTGGGGEHRYFALPQGVTVRSRALAPGLELKAEGGYVVAPPSLHPSGRRYEWEVGRSPDELAPAPLPRWLLELTYSEHGAERGRAYEPLLRGEQVRQGLRHDAALSLAGLLAEKRTPPALALALLQSVRDRLFARGDHPVTDEELENIVQYVYAQEAAEAGEWSSNYRPPVLELYSPSPGDAPSGPDSRRAIPEFSAAELRQQGIERGLKERLPSLPFLGQEGIIIRGASHLLSGYPKTGKSTLLAHVVGEWKAERVLWLSEEPQQKWEERLARLPEDYARLSLAICLALGYPRAALLERVRQGDEGVVIIDGSKLLGIADENDAAQVSKALTPFIAACRERGATLIVTHHTRKGGGDEGEEHAGSHAFLAVVDVGLVYRRDPHGHRRRRVLAGLSRFSDIPDLLLELQEGDRLVCLGDPEQVALEQVKERALACLTEEWRTLADIMALMEPPKPSDETVRQALNALVADGIVERDPPPDRPVRGKAHRWRLRPEQRPPDETYRQPDPTGAPAPSPQEGDGASRVPTESLYSWNSTRCSPAAPSTDGSQPPPASLNCHVCGREAEAFTPQGLAVCSSHRDSGGGHLVAYARELLPGTTLPNRVQSGEGG